MVSRSNSIVLAFLFIVCFTFSVVQASDDGFAIGRVASGGQVQEVRSDGVESYGGLKESSLFGHEQGIRSGLRSPVADNYRVELNSRWASGPCYGVTVQGSMVYIVDGHCLEVVDCTDPSSPNVLGSVVLPSMAKAVAVSGAYAYVADGDNGLRVIDVSNPTNPTEVGSYGTGSSAYDIAVSGTYAYVADWDDGLRVIDVSDPANPTEVGFYDTGDFAFGVAVSGTYAYVAYGGDGLRVIDVSDPANPTEIGFYDAGDHAFDVAVSDTYAYVADLFDGLRVIDVSDPTNPTEVGYYDTGDFAFGVAVSGTYAYVANEGDGLRVIDVNDPSNPTEVGFYDTGGSAEDIAVSGNYTYVADGRDGLRVIDVSDPANPTEIGSYNTGGYARDVVFSGTYAYVIDDDGLRVIDVSDPTNPAEVAFYDTGGHGRHVVVSDTYAYVDDDNGLRVIDVSDPTNPTEVDFYEEVFSDTYIYVDDFEKDLYNLIPNLFWYNVTTPEIADGQRQHFGMSWSDFDNDGWQDLYSSGPGLNALLKNQSGQFIQSSKANDDGTGRAAVWGDYDNDGYLDLFVANIGNNKLFHSYIGIDFSEVSLGPFSASDATFGATWVDYDNDGDLDLYYVNAGGDTNKLLENINGTLRRVQTGSPLEFVGECVGAAWGDYDNDGDQDVYLSNYGTGNLLLQNVGGGQFVDVTNGPLGDVGNGKGAIWADFDNDGDLDLYVINFDSENKLLLNDGHDNLFTVATLPDQSGYLLSHGAAAADYDNDGDIDIYITVDGPNVLLSNQGDGTFTEVSSYVWADSSESRAVAWGDYDNDGALDLYYVNGGAGNRLIKNDSAGDNHWVKVCLRGSVSNSFGVGARVRLVAGGKAQIREITAGEGYLSQGPMIAQFGLGSSTSIDSLIVSWPSGVRDILLSADLDVDQVITVHEGDYLSNTENETPSVTALYQCYPNPSNPSTTIRFSLSHDEHASIRIYDVSGRLIRVLVDRELNAGLHTVLWDGKNTKGKSVSSGIYFYKLETGEESITKKMVLLR